MDIYIGSPITHASEHKFLHELDAHIKDKNINCIVFANFEFVERQFDFIVIIDHSVSIVDAKSTSMPIRGEINGSWQRRLPNGSWGYYKNAYHQVLDCKNRFRNALIDVPIWTGIRFLA